ncbi:hypothetical protein HY484_01755 [Candidatus Woesearchaeota archaeon]|nr:hypothetical protein [Candidatus Woesearchaeota archaeon]
MPKVNPRTTRDVADALRDLKNWVFVFAKEYALPKEALNKLHEKIDELGDKLKNVECK